MEEKILNSELQEKIKEIKIELAKELRAFIKRELVEIRKDINKGNFHFLY